MSRVTRSEPGLPMVCQRNNYFIINLWLKPEIGGGGGQHNAKFQRMKEFTKRIFKQ